MTGGDEEPCISGDHLKLFALETGRECPRVELELENVRAAEVLMLHVGAAFDERMARPYAMLAPFLVAAALDEVEPEDRMDMIRRVHAALASEELREQMSKAEARAESEAKRRAQSATRARR